MEFESTLTIDIVIFAILTTASIVTATYFYMKNFTDAKNIDDMIEKIF